MGEMDIGCDQQKMEIYIDMIWMGAQKKDSFLILKTNVSTYWFHKECKSFLGQNFPKQLEKMALNVDFRIIQQLDSIDIKLLRENMCQRKIWKAQEDEILKEIYQNRGIKQWSQIAKIMEKEYAIAGRNGKQCRERYHNHLKGGISKQKWTPEEENLLIHLHSQHGNRWAMISKLIPGRSQNCVKNMLYSRMRRSVRLLNRFIFLNYRKQLKEINISFIYRLIDFTEKSYKKVEHSRNLQENISIRLKNSLLMLDYNEEIPLSEELKNNIKQLIEDIHTFKRVNQRYRGNTYSKKTERLFKSKHPNSDNTNEEDHILKEDRPTPSNFYLEDKHQFFETTLLLEQAGEESVCRKLLKKINKLDSLDSNCPFLQRAESNLQQQIPMQLPQLKSLMSTYEQIRQNMEGELNNWEDYISQF